MAMWIRKHLPLLSLLVYSPDDQKAAIVKSYTSKGRTRSHLQRP